MYAVFCIYYKQVDLASTAGTESQAPGGEDYNDGKSLDCSIAKLLRCNFCCLATNEK